MTNKKFWLVFSGDLIKEPVVYELSKKFDVVTNIRQASVGDGVGLLCLELAGDSKTIEEAIDWLEARGVDVKPVEINTVEG